MSNLFVCVITTENNNKQYLVFYFYKHVAFLRTFFIKELACFVVVHTFFDQTGNTVHETVQQQHFNKCINIYVHQECCKTSFICCFIVTAKNLI